MIVKTASVATPITTKIVANDHFSNSIIIPRPTAIPPIMAQPSKIKWGQNGSTDPEKNVLIYEGIVAVFVWLLALIAATNALIKQLRHHD